MGRVIEFLVVRVLARLFTSRYRVIPRRSDGAPMLRQFKLFGWAYLQSFIRGEEAGLFHVHRWKRMISFVLSGSFVEERWPGTPFGPTPGRFSILHAAPSVYTMDDTTIHRLDNVAPRTWTLFIMLGNRREWGYFGRPTRVRYQSWDKAIPEQRKVASL